MQWSARNLLTQKSVRHLRASPNFNLLPVRVARRQEICPIMRWVPTLQHLLENDVRVALAAGCSQCVFIIDPRENDDSGF